MAPSDDHAWRYLLDVATRVACVLEILAQADKMNIAALGNMVRQLHVHVIARHESMWRGRGRYGGEVTCCLDALTRAARTQALHEHLLA